MQKEGSSTNGHRFSRDVRQVCHAYCQAYQCSADVDELLTDVFVTAYRHYGPERGSLRNFCIRVSKEAIISELTNAKGGKSNAADNREQPPARLLL